MHIDVVPNRNSKPAYLLRESYREGGKVKKRTLANLSALPIEEIERMRQVLRAGHNPRVPLHDAARDPGGLKRHRGRSLRRERVAAGAAGAHREETVRTPS